MTRKFHCKRKSVFLHVVMILCIPITHLHSVSKSTLHVDTIRALLSIHEKWHFVSVGFFFTDMVVNPVYMCYCYMYNCHVCYCHCIAVSRTVDNVIVSASLWYTSVSFLQCTCTLLGISVIIVTQCAYLKYILKHRRKMHFLPLWHLTCISVVLINRNITVNLSLYYLSMYHMYRPLADCW